MKLLGRYWWFAVLALASAWLLLHREYGGKAGIRHFALSDTGRVSGIAIGWGAETVSVLRGENGWTLGDGRAADAEAVVALLNVLSNLSTESPVPSAMNDSLVHAAKTNGAWVAVSAHGAEALRFSVLFEPSLGRNICADPVSGSAFFVELAGFGGQIPDLLITEESYWLGSRLLSFPMAEVTRVEVDIPPSPEQSYSIAAANGGFELVRKATGVRVANPNADRLSRLFIGLRGLSVSTLAPERQASLLDELKGVAPFRVITLHSATQQGQLALYPIRVDATNELGVSVELDPNRFYVLYADGRVGEATYVNFSAVLWDIADLEAKN